MLERLEQRWHLASVLDVSVWSDDQRIELTEGITLSPDFGQPIAITVTPLRGTVGVAFELDGVYQRTEYSVPLSLFGDVRGVLNRQSLPDGVHVLAYTPEFADGTIGARREVSFNVIAPEPEPTGRPDETTTGPYDRSLLTVYSGVYTISQPGAYENLYVKGQIRINANNVTLRNFVVEASGSNYVALRNDGPDGNGTTGVLVEDGEIFSTPGSSWVDGVGIGGPWQGAANVYRRLHIHHVHDGVKTADNATLLDSYIHDLNYGGGGHSDGVQASGHNWPVTIKGNYIDASTNTAAINNVGSNWIVEGNWLSALNYAIYFNTAAQNPTVSNNVFLGPGSPQRFAEQVDSLHWFGNTDADGNAVEL